MQNQSITILKVISLYIIFQINNMLHFNQTIYQLSSSIFVSPQYDSSRLMYEKT